ncbi:MAG: UbiA family prenyltransferase [Maricaulaceae bacterium]|jgi:4-hydroxybenzoate polyprenyltransferase/phosphoserine phosphatase
MRDDNPPPLAVDLDGTLIKTDTLFERIARALFHQPWALAAALPTLRRGRAAFKAALAERVTLARETLPVRDDLLAYLAEETARGREIHLVTAADRATADAIAEAVGGFASVEASQDGVNLKGPRKLERLKARFPGGFAYAGDSAADLAIWGEAHSIVLAGASPSARAAAKALGRPVEAEFHNGASMAAAWAKLLRPHQWLKNTLIFAPLLLGHAYAGLGDLPRVVLGFLILGVVASSTYVLNDLADLEADRLHHSKRDRPLARGDVKIAHALIAAPAGLVLGLLAALALAPAFAAWLAAYVVLTLAYTIYLKRVPVLDTTVLAGLFTLRLIMGVVVAGVPMSDWLLTFSMFFFFSLSIAKRHTEILRKAEAGETALAGRGYRTADEPLTLGLGVAAGAASVLILVLYLIEDVFLQRGYGQPAFLWAAPLTVFLWLSRVWLLSHRGEMVDDPVVFALKDRMSLVCAVVLALAYFLAVL